MHDLETFLKAASSLVLQVTTGLNNADLKVLSARDRKQARASLANLSNSLGDLLISQTSLVHDLQFYVQLVKHPADGDQEVTFWNSQVLSKVRDVTQAILHVRRSLDDNPIALNVTLAREEQLALKDNLASRSFVLRSFERMPPPQSADDVIKLEALIQHYSALIEDLRRLRLAVDRAEQRLGST
jgi:hypothetical protein